MQGVLDALKVDFVVANGEAQEERPQEEQHQNENATSKDCPPAPFMRLSSWEADLVAEAVAETMAEKKQAEVQ